MENRLRTVKGFVVGIVLGAAILALSPFVVGVLEPWDGGGRYYFFALLSVGVFGSVLFPKKFFVFLTGIFFGQVTYSVLFLPLGPLFIVGFFMMAVYTVIALFAGLVTQAIL